MSLWLEALQPGRPLSFLDAHIKVGNALLGTTPALLAQGIPDEAFTALDGDGKKLVASLRKQNKTEREGQGDLFASAGIRIDNSDFAKAVDEVDLTGGLSLADVHLAQQRQRALDSSPGLQRARLVADGWCAAFMAEKRSGRPGITQAVLLRWQENGLDNGDPALAEVRRLAAHYRYFHWHLEFPTLFRVKDGSSGPGWVGGFSCVIGNPPWDTLSPDTREFFGGLVPDIRTLAKAERDKRIGELLEQPIYRRSWDAHQRDLFAIAHFLKRSGRYRMYAPGNLGKGDFNVYRSFAELALTVTAPGGSAGQIIQSGLYAGANASAIRKALLDECTLNVVYGFDNKGGSWFEGVALENFAAYAARVGRKAPPRHEIRAAFGLPNPRTVLADLAQRVLTISVDDVRAQNPETLAIPDVRDPEAARISSALYERWPSFGEKLRGLPQWSHAREIDMSDKNDVFRTEGPGLPIYEGRMIDFFDHRAKRYVSGHGNNSVWEETPFGDPRKSTVPQWYVEEKDLQNDEVRERTRHYRIGFMDIADPGRQRSFVSTFVPPSTVCGNTVPTAMFPDAEWYGPVYVAIANTLVIDFLVRQRVLSKHIKPYILDTLPIARLSPDDDRSRWLATASLRLTCTSPEMTPLWNQMASWGWTQAVASDAVPGECDSSRRVQLRAAIDAYVARWVYDLSRSDLEVVVETFTQLKGIERKRDSEFRTKRLVLEAFDRLNDPAAVAAIGAETGG